MNCIFISHISQESAVALILQKYLHQSFDNRLQIFVSTDVNSVGGGRNWFNRVIEELQRSSVVLVLVSQYSCGQEWVNFEAGFGHGAAARVIPVSIRDFTFDRLSFPLKALHGRTIGHIEGLIEDIGSVTRLVGKPVDRLEYLKDIRNAEANLVYKDVLLTPYLWGAEDIATQVNFKIQNVGNTDVELLFVEAVVPARTLMADWAVPARSDSTVLMEENGEFRVFRYTTSPGRHSRNPLYSVLTRSMGVRQLPALYLPLTKREDGQLGESKITYQIIGRNYDSEPDTRVISELDLVLERKSRST